MEPFSFSGENGALVYDLRQIYAVIVGEHLIRVSNARAARKYKEWLEALDDLYVEVNQEFKDKDISEYRELRNNVYKTIKKNTGAFVGEDHNPETNAEIKHSLMKLNIFIKKVMKKNKMFGSTAIDSMI